MASVSSTFTGVGASSTLFVKGGERFRLSLTGTWVGTVLVEESNNGGHAWFEIGAYTANAAEDYAAKPFERLIRLRCSAYTSGTATYSIANVVNALGRSKYSTVPIGQVAYGSVGTATAAPSATLMHLTSIHVPVSFLATGVGVLNGGTVGTDNMLVALYDATGKLLANSALAGVVTAGANTFQEVAFLNPVQLPAGNYFIGLQCNGTTTRFRLIAASTNVDVLAGTVTSAFGTVPSTVTVPTTFTADKGVVAYLY